MEGRGAGVTAHRVWFERAFDPGLPPEAFADIVVRLRGTPARLEERTAGLDEATRTARHRGKWSIQEHAGHLLDLEELWIGRTGDLSDRIEELRPADLTNTRTEEAGHNAASLADLLSRFRAVRLGWVERLDGLKSDDVVHTALHPRLKQPMSVVDLAFFVAEHDDHHLAVITALRSVT